MNKSLFVEDQAAAKAEDLVKDIKQVALEMKKLRDTVRIFEKQNNTHRQNATRTLCRLTFCVVRNYPG